MGKPFLETARLVLILDSTEEILARIAAMAGEDQAQVSLAWLSRLREAPEAGPWTHGLSILNRESRELVGSCAFKGPPDDKNTVEIAYGIAPEHRGRGYAREAAAALAEYALNVTGVSCVCAHTLPDNQASIRVLEACGFTFVGEVIDWEDGLVKRWELHSSGS
jgi:ribosomal-protein-alanine N-acetyltransferase